MIVNYRGVIVKVESSGPSHGSLMVVSGKRKLVLNIGIIILESKS